MPLYPSQQQALSAVQQFLETDTFNTFILNGFAGTGKTFLMQELGKMLKNEKKSFVFLASTGRAAAVLRGKTGFDAHTVHSELYHFSKVDGDNEEIPDDSHYDAYGQMKLLFGLRAKDEASKIYIVDEASMISCVIGPDTSFAEFGSGKLLVDLLATVGNNKIIFVGDPCQLPPVAQTFSPALSVNWLQAQQRTCTTATLSEIVRTKADSGILALAANIRGFFTTTFVTSYVKIPAYNKANITVHRQLNDLQNEYIQRVMSTNNDSIAICRSNTDCRKINYLVRQYKYQTPNAPLQIGDVLLVTQNNYLVPLANGDFVVIETIGEQRTLANLHFVNVRVKALISQQDFELLLCLDVLYGSISNITLAQNTLLMIDFSRRMRKKGIRPNSSSYKQSMLKDAYLNSLRANYGYAITCHKAQGGEWENVYVFLNKGMYHLTNEELFRWWYTAFTRAKTHLHLHYDWWIV